MDRALDLCTCVGVLLTAPTTMQIKMTDLSKHEAPQVRMMEDFTESVVLDGKQSLRREIFPQMSDIARDGDKQQRPFL